MRINSYLASAASILAIYDGSLPFAIWLKQYFAANKKFGSKDRKHIANLCYNYFRLGHSFTNYPVTEKLLISQFLNNNSKNIYVQEVRPEWNEFINQSVEEKFNFFKKPVEWQTIFPWLDELSDEIHSRLFALSLLIQPNLYLRLRPGKEDMVKRKLENVELQFEEGEPSCLQIANSTKLDEIIILNEEAVIQDANSQKVLQPLNAHLPKQSKKLELWDCCAGSGGKSILAHDTVPNIALTVSDIRPSILFNLEKRFSSAGIKKYKSFLADLSNSPLTIHRSPFDLIICDAPCSGSGTWSRTPEQLSFFTKDKIDYYADVQKKITQNASKALKQGGYFLYITCSVFKKENEDVVSYLKEKTSLQLISMKYFKGYDVKADTLFTALFTL